MGERTLIEWTKDPDTGTPGNTYNPWQGCKKVSPGCKWCYMHRDKQRYGKDPSVVVRSKDPTFYAPLNKWKTPTRVFCASWSDFFIKEADAWRPEAWEIIRKTKHLYLILTKRPERIVECLPKDWSIGAYPNVWFGTTVEEQAVAEPRITALLSVEAMAYFLSCEPLLSDIQLKPEWLPCRYCCGVGTHFDAEGDESSGPCSCGGVDRKSRVTPDGLRCWRCGCHVPRALRYCENCKARQHRPMIDWIIGGGESGGHEESRPSHPNWFRGLRDVARRHGVPYFFKQYGTWRVRRVGEPLPADYQEVDDGAGNKVLMMPTSVALNGRELDGRFHDGLLGKRQGFYIPCAP